ncbi:hypothetical protein HpHA283_13470 [Helicobacter pylori]
MYKNCVFIIESPNKIAKIKELTGSSFVFATGGHFVELVNIEVSKEFNPIFEIKKSTDKKKDKSTHINYMINQCKDKVVYIATDPDREGYGIGYKFYEKIKNIAKTIYRTEFHEITKSGVEKGLNNAVLFSQSNLNLYYSWLGRIVSDQFVGFTLTPYLRKNIKNFEVSAGRVQTPVLSILVELDRKIQAFEQKNIDEKLSYSIEAIIDVLGSQISITLVEENKRKVFETKELAQNFLNDLKNNLNPLAFLDAVEQKDKEKAPPKPFTTSNLLKDGAIGKLNILSKNELEKREQEQWAKTETNTNSSNKQDKQKLDYRKINYESKEIDDGKFIRIGDEVNHIFIEKAKINRGYLQKPKHKRTWWSLWLYKKPSDDALDIKALDVFDDGKYTYFRYDRDQAFSRFPYTYKVVDGYDNPINSRVVGNYIIAEDVSKKWTLRSGKEYVCVRRDKHKYQKSKDFMRLKRLLEQDEAMKAKRNNIHLIEDTTPQPKNAISVTELLAQIKNQAPSKECRALNEEEVKTLEEVKNIIKAPKPLQKDLKNKLKKHTIKTHYCVPIPYIERPKTTDNLENNKKGLNNTPKQNQANPIKEIKENKK